MDAEPEKETDVKAEELPKPVIPTPHIPPPNLTPPPPPPQSPMDRAPASSPPPMPSGEPAVKVTIRTGDEDVPVAGSAVPFNTRAVAAVIDMVLASGVMMLIAFLDLPLVGNLAWVVAAAYVVTRDSLPFLGGQSVGKKAMKIRAVTLDGKPLTGNWEAGGIRSGVLLIPFFSLVELFILLTRENGVDRGRRLGDEWAKTKVIFEPQPSPAEETPAP
jgi:uncharacterized RDD family membrane protein YckC